MGMWDAGQQEHRFYSWPSISEKGPRQTHAEFYTLHSFSARSAFFFLYFLSEILIEL